MIQGFRDDKKIFDTCDDHECASKQLPQCLKYYVPDYRQCYNKNNSSRANVVSLEASNHYRAFIVIIVRKIKELFFWFIYKIVLKLISILNDDNEPKLNSSLPESNYDNESLEIAWFFCSTIGELNACASFIDKKNKIMKIIILTDRIFYKDSYLEKYPNAKVFEIKSAGSQVQHLLRTFPPKDFYICEIPCSPNDAPCRLPYEVLRAIKNSRAKMYIINGWLYQYKPSCTQDAIERLLFSSDYIRMFDGITVQTESIKKLLIEKGGDKDKICVTGNMKFDALDNPEISSSNIVSTVLIEYFSKLEHVFVAGCLINELEYKKVASAFVEIVKVFPDAVCVFAPRHPEKEDQLNIIEKVLIENNLSYIFKSELEGVESFNQRLLVLDTLGELKNFYSVGTVCYVGRDHNILEPLSFNKMVVVPDGWNSQYPSYPVFDIVTKHNLVTVHKENELGNDLVIIMQNKTLNKDFKKSLYVLRGATKRNEDFFKSINSKIGN